MAGAYGRLALAAALALACLPAVADAGVRRAGSVLPPGQSSFVSVAGVADGTGSPHLKDQIDLFLGFDFKPMTFNQPGTSESPRPGVTIVRDSYGVPAITAGTADDLWFGAGYATAQDRLFQIEVFVRATTGRLSEVLGRSMFERDLATRTAFYTRAELEEQVAALAPEFQARIRSYVDGVNAWVDEVNSDPTKVPGEFPAIAVAPHHYTVADLAAVGVYLARSVPDDDPAEFDNARGLQALGSTLFNKLLPVRAPGVIPTVPKREGRFRRDPRRTRGHEKRALRRSAAFVKDLPIPAEDPASPYGTGRVSEPMDPPDAGSQRAAVSRARAIADSLGPGSLGKGGSDLWAVQNADGSTSLFNGPQLGYDIPSLFYEMELHGPGLDVRGLTAPMAPVIALGHNGHVAWGVTTGASDQDDLYAEQTVGDEGYRFRNSTETMDCRTETIEWNPPPTELIPGSSPPDLSAGSEDVRICRTVHGPVEAREGGVAYARRYATWKRELETLNGLAGVNTAASVRDVDRAIDLVTWNENLMAADDQGNIGYWHPGLLPLKPLRYDERLPYPGTGEAEWRGFLPESRRPRVINPKQGYLANWNNPPSVSWTQSDAGSSAILAGRFHRVAILDRLLRRAHRQGGGYDRMIEVDRAAGTTAQGRPPAASRLKRAHRGSRGTARRLLSLIRRWDGNYSATDADGTVHPGVAAWRAFLTEAVGVSLGRFGDDIEHLNDQVSASHTFDTTNLQAYALRKLSRRGYRLAAERAWDRLVRRFGTDDPRSWREKRQLYKPGTTGAASWDPFPFYDRGSVQINVELGP